MSDIIKPVNSGLSHLFHKKFPKIIIIVTRRDPNQSHCHFE